MERKGRAAGVQLRGACLVVGRAPCRVFSGAVGAEGEPCLGEEQERGTQKGRHQVLMLGTVVSAALMVSGWRDIHLGDGRGVLTGMWYGHVAECCVMSHGGCRGRCWWSV